MERWKVGTDGREKGRVRERREKEREKTIDTNEG